MYIFAEHVSVCNGQANAQNTKCTHFFSVLLFTMDSRLHKKLIFIQCIAVCNG